MRRASGRAGRRPGALLRMGAGLTGLWRRLYRGFRRRAYSRPVHSWTFPSTAENEGCAGKAGLRRDLGGGVSLWVTVMTSGILAFALVLHQVSGLRIFQGELSQAMSGQLAVSLAGYDRELQKRYGLWGFKPEELNTEVFDLQMGQSVTRPLLPSASASASIRAEQPLAEPDVARKQIVAYMRLRAPIALVQEVYQRVTAAGQGLKLQLEAGEAPAREAKQQWDTVGNWLASLEGQELPGNLGILLEPIFQFFAQNRNDASNGEGLQAIFSGLGGLNRLLPDTRLPVYDALVINEYILDFFSSAVTRFGEKESLGRTWRNQSHKDLNTATPYEVEYIITGIEDKPLAARRIKHYLMALRFVQHFAGLSMDQSKQAQYKVIAAAISLLVAVLTAGAVKIEPDAIRVILTLIVAYFNMKKDIGLLLSGEAVDFQPYHLVEPRLYYKDFLRIFILMTGEDNKLRRAISCVEANLGASFSTCAVLEASGSCGIWSASGLTRKEEYELLEKTDR